MNKPLLAGLALIAALGAGHAAAQSTQPAQATRPAQAAQTAPAAPARSIDQADVFLSVCQQPENHDACVMYLAGYTNGALVQTLIDKQPPRYCVPSNLPRKEQLNAIVAWMKGHLQYVLEPTGAVIYKALIGTFPCR
ncbi:Rap1a/Tai family immunity protein [Paraburkholderia oxyphila]|uniref:Rap1a/Tai family immunity protein n=1 Tax=Paraburkholderia oxyphila TaxID=614212 RepID=UPI0012EEC75F|nr:Rap1a/Tai family immunity protein [Paraburkholderia oxyphila]